MSFIHPIQMVQIVNKSSDAVPSGLDIPVCGDGQVVKNDSKQGRLV